MKADRRVLKSGHHDGNRTLLANTRLTDHGSPTLSIRGDSKGEGRVDVGITLVSNVGIGTHRSSRNDGLIAGDSHVSNKSRLLELAIGDTSA